MPRETYRPPIPSSNGPITGSYKESPNGATSFPITIKQFSFEETANGSVNAGDENSPIYGYRAANAKRLHQSHRRRMEGVYLGGEKEMDWMRIQVKDAMYSVPIDQRTEGQFSPYVFFVGPENPKHPTGLRYFIGEVEAVWRPDQTSDIKGVSIVDFRNSPEELVSIVRQIRALKPDKPLVLSPAFRTIRVAKASEAQSRNGFTSFDNKQLENNRSNQKQNGTQRQKSHNVFSS